MLDRYHEKVRQYYEEKRAVRAPRIMPRSTAKVASRRWARDSSSRDEEVSKEAAAEVVPVKPVKEIGGRICPLFSGAAEPKVPQVAAARQALVPMHKPVDKVPEPEAAQEETSHVAPKASGQKTDEAKDVKEQDSDDSSTQQQEDAMFTIRASMSANGPMELLSMEDIATLGRATVWNLSVSNEHGSIQLCQSVALSEAVKDLKKTLLLTPKQLELFPAGTAKPAKGEGLNQEMVCQLYHMSPVSQKTGKALDAGKYSRMLQRVDPQAFVSYKEEEHHGWCWSFRVDPSATA